MNTKTEVCAAPKSGLMCYTTKKDVPFIVLGTLLVSVAAAGLPAQTYIYGKAFSKLTHYLAGTMSTESFVVEVRTLCGAIMAVGAGRMLFSWLGIVTWLFVGEQAQSRARSEIFAMLMDKNIEWFDTKANLMGSMAVVNRCVEEIRTGVSENLGLLVQTIALLVFLFVTAMCSLWSLTLVIIASAPLMAILSKGFGVLTVRFTKLENLYSASASKVLDWCFASGTEVRAFNGKHYDAVKFNLAVDKSARAFFRMALSIAGNSTVLRFLSNIVFLQGFLFGKRMIELGKLDVAKMFTAFSACLLVGSQLSSVADTISLVHRARASAASIENLGFMDQPVEACASGEDVDVDCTSISMENVEFRYKSSISASLKEVSTRFDSASLNFIVGKSGSGKSTLALLLSGLLLPTLGEINVGSVNFNTLSNDWHTKHITYVELNSTVFDRLLKDNILLGALEISEERLHAAVCFAGLTELVRLLPDGLDSQVKESSLSGGQKQKVGLARAYVRDSPILILDEATTAIDPVSRAALFRQIRQWREGRLTIVITHNTQELEESDNVLVLEDGVVKTDAIDFELDDIAFKMESDEMSIEASDQESIEKSSDARFSAYDYLSNPAVLRDLELGSTERELVPMGLIAVLNFCFTTSQHKFLISLGLVASLLSGVTPPILSYCFAKLLSLIIVLSLVSYLKWIFVIAGIATADALFYFSSQASLSYALEMWVVQLRKGCLSVVNDQDMSFFSTKYLSPAELTTLLMNDTRDLRNLVLKFLSAVLLVITLTLFGVTWAVVIGWKLALTGLAFVPLIILVTVSYGALLARYETRYKSCVASAEALGHNVVAGIRTVKSFGLALELAADFKLKVSYIHAAGIKRAVAAGFGIALSELCTSVATGAILYYGMYLVAHLDYSLDQMLQVMVLLMFTMTSASTLMYKLPEIARGQRAGTLLARLHTLTALPTEAEGTLTAASHVKLPILALDGVSLTYANLAASCFQPVLKDLSFTVQPSECVAVVGQTGAGKSTIGLLLARLIQQDKGDILLFGKNITEYSTDWYKSTVSLVPQQAKFFEGTVLENLTYGIPASKIDLSFVEDCLQRANAFDFVKNLPQGLYTIIGGASGASLSLGQKQRLSIARALVRRPKLLIMDEPTSNLDSENCETIHRLITTDLKLSYPDLTIVVITHDVSLMRKVPRLLVVGGGAIAEDGDYETLMSRHGELHQLVN